MAMAPAGRRQFTLVQMQNLMFLIDRELTGDIPGAPFFEFQPNDYGPFDRGVYDELADLERDGMAEILRDSDLRTYRLTSSGLQRGGELLTQQNSWVAEGITQYSEWVRRLTFAELVTAIYKKYPEMKANTVFRR